MKKEEKEEKEEKEKEEKEKEKEEKEKGEKEKDQREDMMKWPGHVKERNKHRGTSLFRYFMMT